LKKLLVVILFVATMGISFGSSDKGETKRDAVRAGWALAQKFWDYYEASIGYLDPNDENYHRMVAKLDLNLNVIELELDSQVVICPSDEPLPGIPLPEGGMKYASISIDAFRGGHPKLTGGGYFEKIQNGDFLQVILRPQEDLIWVPYNLSGEYPENSRNLELVSPKGDWLGYYRDWIGGFVLEIDPSIDPIYVRVINRETNNYLESFWLDPMEEDGPTEFDGSSINLNLIGNVLRIVPNQYGAANYFSQIDGYTDFGDRDIPAKALIYEDELGQDLYLYVSGEGTKDSMINVTAYDVTKGGLKEIGNVDLIVHEPVFSGEIPYFNVTVRIPKSDSYRAVMFLVKFIEGEPVGPWNFYFSVEYPGKG
jgi:hypothetical protein